MFIISRLPLKNRICASLLTTTMCVAIASLSYSYLVVVWIINVSYRNSDVLKLTLIVASGIWLGIIGLVAFLLNSNFGPITNCHVISQINDEITNYQIWDLKVDMCPKLKW